MKTRPSAYLLWFKHACLALMAVIGLLNGSPARADDPSLVCENDFIKPVFFPQYPQVLQTAITVLTDADTPPGQHTVSVIDTDHHRFVAVYRFTINMDGAVIGGGPQAQTTNTLTCPASTAGYYYSTVIAVDSCAGYNFPTSGPSTPLDYKFPDITSHRQYILDDPIVGPPIPDHVRDQAIVSQYSHKTYALIHGGIYSFLGNVGPYTPGASAPSPNNTVIQFELPGKLAQAKSQPFPCAAKCCGMAVASLDRFQAGIAITDTPISYTPAVGRSMAFTVNYHQRLANQPATFNYSNVGAQWNFSWIAYIAGGPGNSQGQATYYAPDGSQYIYTGYKQQVAHGPGTPSINQGDFQDNEGWTHSTLHYRQDPERYERWLPDGTIETYAQQTQTTTTNRLFFLSLITDPQGYVTTLNYDANAAANGQAILTSIKDATGGQLIFGYDAADSLKIIKVTRSTDGLSARLHYTSGQLTSITDPIGITSSFHYSSSTFIDTMVTPYGTTTFSSTDGSGFLEADMTNPIDQASGHASERVEYQEIVDPLAQPVTETAPTASGLNIDNSNLNHANTFYWNRRAMYDAVGVTVDMPPFYHLAEVTHWAQNGMGSFPVPLSVRKRSDLQAGGRVWYNYQNQPDADHIDVWASGSTTSPSVTAQVLDDSTTQASYATYDNPYCLITKSIDAVGRTTNYSYYANGIDLYQVTQVNGGGSDLLSTMTYNSKHQPLTIKDASGQTTTMTYYSTADVTNGELHTSTNAKGETTTMAYDSGTGYPTSVTGTIAGATTSYAYDSTGRVHTVTDSEGYTLTYTYDNLDRLTKVTYPDSTTDQTVYNKLDVAQQIDRQSRATTNTYDAIRELISTTDPLGRTTQYGWCTCGGLASITDADKNVTTWGLDGMGRVTSKTYADGSVINYAYESNTNRLHSMTDAVTNAYNTANSASDTTAVYSYNPDNTLASINYTAVTGVASTPNVSFAYDTAYNRVTGMSAGTSYTYSYNPINGSIGSGRLATVTVPIASTTATVAYTYDQLGRVTNRTIDSTSNSSSTTYDALGRVTSVVNNLCPSSQTFTYNYVDETSRLSSVTYPSSSHLTTNYSYFGNTSTDGNPGDDDQRLQTIENKYNGSDISKFDYTYNHVGTIATWKITDNGTGTITNTLTYDNVDQLLSQSVAGTPTNTYAYDPVGNRLGETTSGGTNGGQFNDLNQLTAYGGALTGTTLSGYVSSAVTNVTVDDYEASVISGTSYSATVPLPVGSNVITVVAQDSAGDINTKQFGLIVTGTATPTLTYDANGNCTKDENGNTYQWDACNRLTAIIYGSSSPSYGTHTEFAYDGLGRRVQIVERAGTTIGSGMVSSTKNYIWVGSEIAEERASNGTTINKQFYPQGEIQSVSGTLTPYYYFRDHLGSVRELMNSSGTLFTRYSYDPYGRTTPAYSSSNTSTPLVDATKQYGNYYIHATSGLYLTKYRAYDPNTGKWFSRDPIAENGGINLYGYCGDNPLNFIDPMGLGTWTWTLTTFDESHGGERALVTASYTMDENEKKCCDTFIVLRWGKFWYSPDWFPDSGPDDSTIGNNHGQSASAPPDQPGGVYILSPIWPNSPNIYSHNLQFKWCAVCTSGKRKGQTLSCTEKTLHLQFGRGANWTK